MITTASATPTISYDQLRSRGACRAGRQFFSERWGKGAASLPIIAAALATHQEGPSWWEWLNQTKIIPASVWAEYYKVRQDAYAEFQRVRQLAEAEFQRVSQPAYAEYQRVSQPAEAEYQRVMREWLADYGQPAAMPTAPNAIS